MKISDTPFPFLEQPPYFTNPSFFIGKMWPPLFRKNFQNSPPPCSSPFFKRTVGSPTMCLWMCFGHRISTANTALEEESIGHSLQASVTLLLRSHLTLTNLESSSIGSNHHNATAFPTLTEESIRYSCHVLMASLLIGLVTLTDLVVVLHQSSHVDRSPF